MARSIPVTPPNSARMMFSVNNCRTSLAGVAPTEARIAISSRRFARRTSSRLAMFEQVIRSTRQAAPCNSSNPSRQSPTITSFTVRSRPSHRARFSADGPGSRRTVSSSSRSAAFKLTPVLSRAIGRSRRMPLFRIDSSKGGGTQRSHRAGRSKLDGITPTTASRRRFLRSAEQSAHNGFAHAANPVWARSS